MTLLLHNSNGTASWLQSQIKAWSLSRIFGPEPFLRQSWRKTHKWSLPQQLCVKKCLRLSDFPRTHSFSCRQRPHDPASEESFTRQSHRRKRGFEKPLKKASHLLRAQEDLPSVPWMEKSTGTLLKSCSGCFACLLSSFCQEKMDLLHFSNYWSDIYLCFICFLCAKLGDLCNTRPSNDEGNYFMKPWDRMGCHIFRQTCIERVWKWKLHVRPHAAHSLNPHWNVCSVYACIKNHWWFLSGTHLYIYFVVDDLIVIVHMYTSISVYINIYIHYT